MQPMPLFLQLLTLYLGFCSCYISTPRFYPKLQRNYDGMLSGGQIITDRKQFSMPMAISESPISQKKKVIVLGGDGYTVDT
jgi:hypothetical protein